MNIPKELSTNDHLSSWPNQTECCICREISTGCFFSDFQKIYGVKNRLCHDTGSTVLLPSISPLVTGHMLVFPKNHVRSLLHLDDTTIDDLYRTFNYALSRLPLEQSEVFIFEHGLSSDGGGGCGISHAHLHILSLHNRVINDIKAAVLKDFKVQASGSLRNLQKHRPTDMQYLLIGSSLEELTLSTHPIIQSQYMRRIIGTALGLDKWDWRALSGVEMFQKAIQMMTQ